MFKPNPTAFLETRGFTDLKEVEDELKKKEELWEKYKDTTDFGTDRDVMIEPLKNKIRLLKKVLYQHDGLLKVHEHPM